MLKTWTVATLLAVSSPAWAEGTDPGTGEETPVGIVKVLSLGPSPNGCNIFLFNANAYFLRATTFCGRDYLDTKEGYFALAGARKCHFPKDEALRRVKAALLSFDHVAQQQGVGLACTVANGMVRAIDERDQ